MFRSISVIFTVAALVLPAFPVASFPYIPLTVERYEEISAVPGRRLFIFDSRALLPTDPHPSDVSAARLAITTLASAHRADDIHIISENLEDLQKWYGDIEGIHLGAVGDQAKMRAWKALKPVQKDLRLLRDEGIEKIFLPMPDDDSDKFEAIKEIAEAHVLEYQHTTTEDFIMLRIPEDKGRYVRNLLESKHSEYKFGISFSFFEGHQDEGIVRAMRDHAFYTAIMGKPSREAYQGRYCFDGLISQQKLRFLIQAAHE